MKKQIVLETGRIEHSMKVQNPFIACMYHKDAFPRGNVRMEPAQYLERWRKGSDFNPAAPWRMYHGDTVPGFPVHPHRGFETVTVVTEGVVDHADGLGACGRYAHGDVQWMTAGAGLQHTEMFPLVHEDKENPLELFQVWLNLPAKSKFAPPHYRMLWQEEIPVIGEKDDHGHGVTIRLIAGRYGSFAAPPPNPDSWAADAQNHVGIFLIELEENAVLTMPAGSQTLGRMLYLYSGQGVMVEDTHLVGKSYARVAGDQAVRLMGGEGGSKVLVLEGEPINEPVVAYGPFVMNTREEIAKAYADYEQTAFGGWPWPDDAPVQPKAAGRFARYADGKEERPPQQKA